MNKLSKQKRDHLILIALGTVGVLVALWFLLITAQQQNLAKIQKSTSELEAKIEKAESTLRRARDIEAELAVVTEQLEAIEATMTSGDTYSWILDTMNRFIAARPLANFISSRENPGEVMALPKFPYKAAVFQIRLTGYYHDLGRFLADLENSFPFFRVQNLDVTLPSAAQADREKLELRFELVTLTKP